MVAEMQETSLPVCCRWECRQAKTFWRAIQYFFLKENI